MGRSQIAMISSRVRWEKRDCKGGSASEPIADRAILRWVKLLERAVRERTVQRSRCWMSRSLIRAMGFCKISTKVRWEKRDCEGGSASEPIAHRAILRWVKLLERAVRERTVQRS